MSSDAWAGTYGAGRGREGGVEIGRASDLYLSAQIQSGSARVESARVTDVRVAGSTVLVAKGQLFLS